MGDRIRTHDQDDKGALPREDLEMRARHMAMKSATKWEQCQDGPRAALYLDSRPTDCGEDHIWLAAGEPLHCGWFVRRYKRRHCRV